MDYLREAGLPKMQPDTDAQTHMPYCGKGTITAVYPEQWRVDITPEHGGLLHRALVIGPYLPPVHEDTVRPSHCIYVQVGGFGEDVACWPLPHRRLLDLKREWTEKEGKNSHEQKDVGESAEAQGKDDEPERHFYHVHLHCERAGDITVRITDDARWIVESEAGDIIRYDQKRREVDILAPTIRAGSIEHTRIEYVRGEHVHVVMPIIRLGTPDSDQQLILGNDWQDFYNKFVNLFNGHRHMQVRIGPDISGPPFQRTDAMPDDLLSDISFTQKSFPEE